MTYKPTYAKAMVGRQTDVSSKCPLIKSLGITDNDCITRSPEANGAKEVCEKFCPLWKWENGKEWGSCVEDKVGRMTKDDRLTLLSVHVPKRVNGVYVCWVCKGQLFDDDDDPDTMYKCKDCSRFWNKPRGG